MEEDEGVDVVVIHTDDGRFWGFVDKHEVLIGSSILIMCILSITILAWVVFYG